MLHTCAGITGLQPSASPSAPSETFIQTDMKLQLIKTEFTDGHTEYDVYRDGKSENIRWDNLDSAIGHYLNARNQLRDLQKSIVAQVVMEDYDSETGVMNK